MVAVIVIIAANSRTPILGILLGGVIIFCWRLGGKRLVFPVFIIVLLIPLIFSFIDIQSLLSQINLDLVAFTRKKDITELATLNNRVLIWSTILNKYGGFEAIHLVGYGAFGHISSGISYIYAQYWRDPELITLHNAYLQHLIDDGYIGFFVFIALLWNAIRVSLNQLSNGNLAFLYPFAVLIYLVVCSTLDVTIYFNQNVSFLFFLLANFQVAFGEKKLLEKHNGELLPEPI